MRIEWRGWGSFLFILAIASTLLLIYASLIPLDFKFMSAKETYLRWKGIPWLEISLYSRSDWIANALVVMPGAFLLSGAVDVGRSTRWVILFAAPVIALFFCAIVLAIELLQVWFPPRTVSQNDIFAGCMGAIGGVSLWLILGRRCIQAVEDFFRIETVSARLRWLAGLGCVLSLLYTLYPFDFVVSYAELREKMELGRLSWFMSWEGQSKVEFVKGIGLSFLKMFPFGLWFGLAMDRRHAWWALLSIAVGLEAMQIPVYSKYASLTEGLAGTVGGLVGYVAPWVWSKARPLWRRKEFWILAIIGWSVVLWFAFNARYETILVDQKMISARWREFFGWPLLRYYYTSEYSALSNLLGKMVVFGVLGVWVSMCSLSWAGENSRFDTLVRRGYWFGLVWCVALATMIEVAQIYLPPILGDASDIGIYATGYTVGFWLTALVVRPSAPKVV